MIPIGYPTMGRAWWSNKPGFEKLAAELGIHVPLDDVSPLAPYGPMFVARPEALRLLKEAKTRLRAEGCAGSNVQEEVGLLGARQIAYTLKPDIALVVDVTHATDYPTVSKAQHGDVKLGKGPTITHGGCNHPEVVARLEAVARAKKIPLQHEAMSSTSGPDTDVIFWTRGGIPSALISLPNRYMHSPVEVVSLADLEQIPQLLAAFAASSGPLVEAINTFFDKVLVNDPDPEVKAARLGLLASVRELAPAGLDYAAVGPEHAWLRDQERAGYTFVTDEQALAGFHTLCRLEGIIPALESAHAIAHVLDLAPTMRKDQIILVNVSGRGDKDLDTVLREGGG